MVRDCGQSEESFAGVLDAVQDTVFGQHRHVPIHGGGIHRAMGRSHQLVQADRAEVGGRLSQDSQDQESRDCPAQAQPGEDLPDVVAHARQVMKTVSAVSMALVTGDGESSTATPVA